MEDIQIHYSLSYKDKIIYKINLSHGVWSKLCRFWILLFEIKCFYTIYIAVLTDTS